MIARDPLRAADAPPQPGLYHGWLVVGAAFLVALFGWGLGFYGLGIYLVALRERFGWSTAAISSAITTYYIVGATLVLLLLGRAFDRHGARRTVAAGSLAMACGVALLTVADRPWHAYAAFAVMSAGWATMSGAAINIIVAPWFDRRRGLAVSLALNGASAGGIVIAPLLVFLIGRFGFAAGLDLAAALMLAILLPTTLLVLRPKRPGEHDRADAAAVQRPHEFPRGAAPAWRVAAVLCSARFLTIAVPFALGLAAQVGFITHQIAFLSPMIGTEAAGWAVSLASLAAVAGRVGTGFVVDRVHRRVAAGANFAVQIAAMAVLLSTRSTAMLYLGCVLFGLGVGNMISLPGLIVQQEFPREHFAQTVSLVVAINQFTFAFGPGLLGELRQMTGGYAAALTACLMMEAIAAVIVVSPLIVRRRRAGGAAREEA